VKVEHFLNTKTPMLALLDCMKATQGWRREKNYFCHGKITQIQKSSTSALLHTKWIKRTSSGRVHGTEDFFETCYSPHSTADCICVLHWRVTIQTGPSGQEKVLFGCDTVFAWLDSS